MSDTSLWHSLFSRPSHSIEAIDWCESNNAVTALVKEFWNTISNLMFVIVGLLICRQSKHLGLSWKFSGTGICVLLTGIASAYFHATLTLHGQRADEIFENLILVFLFRLDDNHGLRLWVHAFAASFGILFVSAVLFCELHLIVMALLNTFRLYKLQLPMSGVDSKKKFFSRNVVLAALLAIFGFVCWLIDRLACSWVMSLPINPQLHALWHVLSALSLHRAFCCSALAHLCLRSPNSGSLAVQYYFGVFALIEPTPTKRLE